MLVQMAFFASYAIFALPAGKLVEMIGYKRTMVAGLLVMAMGALLFIPAAAAPSYPLFLGALIVLAAGITGLQVSANPYVSVLGPERTASIKETHTASGGGSKNAGTCASTTTSFQSTITPRTEITGAPR